SIDGRVTRAPAEVPGKAVLHLPERRVRSERNGCHDHPGRTDPALGATMFHEHGLQWMPAVESLDGYNASAVNLSERHKTRIHRQAIDEHRACATLAFSAPFLGAGELTGFTQHVEQSRHRVCPNVGAFAVQRETHAAMIFSGVAGISRTSMPACRI